MDGVRASCGERALATSARRLYFFFAGCLAGAPAPPPKGFGGSATPLRPVALPAAFAFEPFAPFAVAGGGSGGVGATAAITGGAGSAAGAAVVAALATETAAAAEGADSAEADVADDAFDAAAVAFEPCGASSEAPAMISAAVPTTTHTPSNTRQTRSAMLGFGGACTGNEADASDCIIARWLGSASGV